MRVVETLFVGIDADITHSFQVTHLFTGLSIHTFHGNFFVRSTDLLSLANVNPDSGFAVQMSIEESLADTSLVCFQAALLYTSSKGTQMRVCGGLCYLKSYSINIVYGFLH